MPVLPRRLLRALPCLAAAPVAAPPRRSSRPPLPCRQRLLLPGRALLPARQRLSERLGSDWPAAPCCDFPPWCRVGPVGPPPRGPRRARRSAQSSAASNCTLAHARPLQARATSPSPPWVCRTPSSAWGACSCSPPWLCPSTPPTRSAGGAARQAAGLRSARQGVAQQPAAPSGQGPIALLPPHRLSRRLLLALPSCLLQILREQIVPSAKAYPLDALMADCQEYFRWACRVGRRPGVFWKFRPHLPNPGRAGLRCTVVPSIGRSPGPTNHPARVDAPPAPNALVPSQAQRAARDVRVHPAGGGERQRGKCAAAGRAAAPPRPALPRQRHPLEPGGRVGCAAGGWAGGGEGARRRDP